MRESQKSWGHRRDDRRSHEPWGQHGDVREKGSQESWGQQELGRDSRLHEQWNQRENIGGLSSVPWVQRGGGEGGVTPGHHDESTDSTIKEPLGHHNRHREQGSHDPFKDGDGGLPKASDQQVEARDLILQEPVVEQGDPADITLEQPVCHETEDSVRSEKPVLKLEESIESRLADSVGQHVEVKELALEEQAGKQMNEIELFPPVPLRQQDELKGVNLVDSFSFVKVEPMVSFEQVEQHDTASARLPNDALEEIRGNVCEEPVLQPIEGEQKELDGPLAVMLVPDTSSDLSIQQHEKESEEALGHIEEEKQRSVELVNDHDESRGGGSDEPVVQGVLEEVGMLHEDCQAWRSEEPVVQHKQGISGESVVQHDDCKVWLSEESVGQYGESSVLVEIAGPQEDFRERGSEDPASPPRECKDGVSDVPILHPDRVGEVASALSIEQHVENAGYHDKDIEKVLEKPVLQEGVDLRSEEPSVAHVKDAEKASEEILQQVEVGLIELSRETVGQHAQDVEGLSMEYVEPQVDAVERSHQKQAWQEQDKVLMVFPEPVRQLELTPLEPGEQPGSSLKSATSDLPAQQEDTKRPQKENGENATQETFVKEEFGRSKFEGREEDDVGVSPNKMRPQEPRETCDETLLPSVERSMQYTNVDIKEWQVEEVDAAAKSDKIWRELECGSGQNENSQRSREKQKSFEDDGDVEIKTLIPLEEELGARVGSKHRRHRGPDEEWEAHREKKHSSRAEERAFKEREDADMSVEDGERSTSTKMKHRKHRAHDGDRGAHREKKRMTEDIDRTEEENKDIQAINIDDNVEYSARDEIKLRRHRGYLDDKRDRKPRGREEERFEEEDHSEHDLKHWDWEKDEGAIVEEQMEFWSGRMHGENEEHGEKVSENTPWSSKREKKREEKEDGVRERKHKGRERREKQEDDTGGERRHGSSRKKRKRDKSWDDDEGVDGEKKHRSREHRREKQQAEEEDGRDVHMKNWGDVKVGQRQEKDESEQWVGSREMDADDYGIDLSEEMLYWSSQDQDQQDKVVGERKRESSRKERKRGQDGEEAESERKYWGGTERQSKRDEEVGGQESKSGRKKERRREHEDAGGGERKHRSSRKKQRRREEDEWREEGSKWSDHESERKKGRLGELDGEDECEEKHMGEGRERVMIVDQEGGDMDVHDASNRLEISREEDFEYYLSAREKEQHGVTPDVQHPDAERIQANVCEKERKRGKLQEHLGEVGQAKDGVNREKEGNVEDSIYTEVVRHKVQEHGDSDKQQYNDGERGTNVDKTIAESSVERHNVWLDWERRKEKLGGEDMLGVVGHVGSSKENKEAERDIQREVKHAPEIEAKRSQFKEGDVAEQNSEPLMERISEPETGGDWDVQCVPETEGSKLVMLRTGGDEWIDGGKAMKQKPVSIEEKETEGFGGADTKHTIGLERRLEWSVGEVRREPAKRARRMFLEDPGAEVTYVHVKEERTKASLQDVEVESLAGRVEGTKVEHAFGIFPKPETMAVDRGGEQSRVIGFQQETNSEQYLQQEFGKNRHIDGIPLAQPVFNESGYVRTFDKPSEQLPTPPTSQEEGGGVGGKDVTTEKPITPLPSTQDGSIRERERRREMLLRSLASFKESGGADRKKEQPPTKEDVGRFGGKESMKIELLSPALSRQLAAGGAKERKKDHLLPPPTKEEKSSNKETKEELQTTPVSKDLDGEERCVGPLPAEASQTRRRKVLEFERVYLDNLPSATMYERSYMHRDVITHVACTKTDFIITASHDGHVKFWKKIAEGIEFVKHFRSHLGVIESIAVSSEGALFCSVGEDQAMKVFDVVNFDMINMLKLGYHPGQCEWIFCPGDAISAVASSEKSSGKIYVYDGRGTNKPMHVFERLHSSPLTQIRMNSIYKVVVSADKTGMMEYWTGPPQEYKFPKNVHWEYKTDTDLYEFAKCKAHLTSMCFSPDGKKIATIGSDRKVRIFRFLTGKLMRVFDESLSMFTELQQMRQQLPDMEFGRRMAVERELEKVDAIRLINIIFDETGHFVLYGTMLGIKVINVETNRCVRILGKQENVRILQISMFQGVARKHRAATTVEMKASDNPVLLSIQADPTIVCTAFKKNRFYLFSKREPEDTKSADSDRDVFNEKPSKEEVMAATQAEGPKRVSDSAIVHTSMGDVHVKLFPVECPKTVENFCVHSRNGYYNGHTFHRIIKGFMVQTGDPSGTGMGGESIWGGEFEDEFHSTLRHDRPYTISMANAGPNSNGSQFFLTVVPTPWLDNKHTVFGRVTKGMEVVQRISNVKVNPKTDKPYEDISIISITVK